MKSTVGVRYALISAGLLALAQAANAATTDLCEPDVRVLQFDLESIPPSTLDATMSRKPGADGLIVYTAKITPRCSGWISVSAYERGTRFVSENPGSKITGSANERFPSPPAQPTQIDDGAFLRMIIDNDEVCRVHDGRAAPPRDTGYWQPATNFENYNLYCGPLEWSSLNVFLPWSDILFSRPKQTRNLYQRHIVQGRTVELTLIRWNKNARPDATNGFAFEITFRPDVR